jgi:hypothetical protein
MFPSHMHFERRFVIEILVACYAHVRGFLIMCFLGMSQKILPLLEEGAAGTASVSLFAEQIPN